MKENHFCLPLSALKCFYPVGLPTSACASTFVDSSFHPASLLAAGWPKLLWFVTESKHLSKPPRDWFPHIKDANNDTAYIEVSEQVHS